MSTQSVVARRHIEQRRIVRSGSVPGSPAALPALIGTITLRVGATNVVRAFLSNRSGARANRVSGSRWRSDSNHTQRTQTRVRILDAVDCSDR